MVSTVDRDGVALDLDLPSDYGVAVVMEWASARRNGFRALWLLRLRDSGLSYGEIARMVGLHRSHVCRVVCRARIELNSHLNPEVSN
jgi:DNA-directed RNA polymerase specialized sigma24 family protein